jgi:hypothetical protein
MNSKKIVNSYDNVEQKNHLENHVEDVEIVASADVRNDGR